MDGLFSEVELLGKRPRKQLGFDGGIDVSVGGGFGAKTVIGDELNEVGFGST